MHNRHIILGVRQESIIEDVGTTQKIGFDHDIAYVGVD